MSTYKITHYPTKERFEAEIEGHTAYIEYASGHNYVDVLHTIVPQPIEGRGVAAALMNALLVYVSDCGKKIKTSCSYAQVYMRRHPEHNHLLYRE